MFRILKYLQESDDQSRSSFCETQSTFLLKAWTIVKKHIGERMDREVFPIGIKPFKLKQQQHTNMLQKCIAPLPITSRKGYKTSSLSSKGYIQNT